MSWWGPAVVTVLTTADQALTAGSWVQLTWGNRYGSSFDATGDDRALFYHVSGSQLYAYRSGWYVLNYHVGTVIASPQNDTVIARLRKNGSVTYAGSYGHCGVGTTYHERSVSGSQLFYIVPGDYFELEVKILQGPSSGTTYASGGAAMGRSRLIIQEVPGATLQEAEITFTSRAGDPNLERGLMGQAVVSDASPVRVRQAAASINATAVISAADNVRVRQAAASVNGTAVVSAANPIRVRQAAATVNATATASGDFIRIRRGKSGAVGRATASGTAQLTAKAAASITGSGFIRGAVAYRRRQAEGLADGTATATGNYIRTRRGKAGAVATATASGVSSVYRPGAASVLGAATATGTALSLRLTGATGAMTFGAEALGTLAVQLAFPSIPRAFSGRLAEGSPSDLVSVGAKGDPSVNNLMVVNGANDLGLSPSYSGPDYLFSGPVDVSSSPLKLGFKKGDKVRLTGAGANGGLEFTIGSFGAVPGTLSVVEDLTTPDATEYQFSVIRRLT